MDRGAFIARMNSIVGEWGASTTHFIEPTGLAPENVSSAQDYALIAREALKDPILAKAASLPEYRFTTVSAGKAHRIKNTNPLVISGRYAINGSKTGYLDEAGYCLFTSVKGSGGNDVIVVTMGAATRSASFYQTEELIKYGLRKMAEVGT